jgi:ferredoxin-thioredoxin reductase catalytic subunit
MENSKDFKDALDQTRRFVISYAERSGYRLNPDAEHVEGLVEEMTRNKLEFGARYCPCMTKRITGDKKADMKRICPCIWHKEDIEKFHICYCGLYVGPQFDPEKHKGVPPSESKKYD